MKSENVKVQPAKILANVSLKLGKMSADNACCCNTYIYVYWPCTNIRNYQLPGCKSNVASY